MAKAKFDDVVVRSNSGSSDSERTPSSESPSRSDSPVRAGSAGELDFEDARMEAWLEAEDYLGIAVKSDTNYETTLDNANKAIKLYTKFPPEVSDIQETKDFAMAYWARANANYSKGAYIAKSSGTKDEVVDLLCKAWIDYHTAAGIDKGDSISISSISKLKASGITQALVDEKQRQWSGVEVAKAAPAVQKTSWVEKTAQPKPLLEKATDSKKAQAADTKAPEKLTKVQEEQLKKEAKAREKEQAKQAKEQEKAAKAAEKEQTKAQKELSKKSGKSASLKH